MDARYSRPKVARKYHLAYSNGYFGPTAKCCAWCDRIFVPAGYIGRKTCSAGCKKMSLSRLQRRKFIEERGSKYCHCGKEIFKAKVIDCSQKCRDERLVKKCRVVAPNGRVFDYTNKKAPYRPVLVEWNCVDCGTVDYVPKDKGKIPNRCVRCNAHNGSNNVTHEPFERDCADCGAVFIGRSNSQRCDPCWSVHTKTIKRLKGYRERAAHYGAAYDSSVTLRAVADRDGMQCQLCSRPVIEAKADEYHPRSWSVDHIRPLSACPPGGHTWDNVQLACRQCNSIKGAKMDGYTMPSDNAGQMQLL